MPKLRCPRCGVICIKALCPECTRRLFRGVPDSLLKVAAPKGPWRPS